MIRRWLLCGLLNAHKGDVETTRVETERHILALTFVRCSRCGDVHTVYLRPWTDMERNVLGEPAAEEVEA